MSLLNSQQLDLIKDQDFLIEKRIVLNVLARHFQKVESGLKSTIHRYEKILPKGSLTVTGRISRGDNYKGLPYLVLDFPRFSSGDKVFIYRTMFWWGNYFLCMLITKNCGYSLIQKKVPKDLMINLGSTPWNYDMNDECWESLEKQRHQFLAISRKVDFGNIDNLEVLSKETFEDIMSLLTK
ncbi:MAG: hypothetical protein O2887_14445 [Bacteroidetes bacterium]|nr:hypothetical protein [Bacteroidota bacterium]